MTQIYLSIDDEGLRNPVLCAALPAVYARTLTGIAELARLTLDFPLTKEGCQAVGRLLARLCVDVWVCSSSIDHPQEYAPECDYDVRAEVLAGYTAAQAESCTLTVRA